MKCTSESISAGEFKSKCLKIMDEVNSQHKTIIITKYGKPIAKLVPFDDHRISLFGAMKGSMKMKGDIVESIEEAWDVDE